MSSAEGMLGNMIWSEGIRGHVIYGSHFSVAAPIYLQSGAQSNTLSSLPIAHQRSKSKSKNISCQTVVSPESTACPKALSDL